MPRSFDCLVPEQVVVDHLTEAVVHAVPRLRPSLSRSSSCRFIAGFRSSSIRAHDVEERTRASCSGQGARGSSLAPCSMTANGEPKAAADDVALAERVHHPLGHVRSGRSRPCLIRARRRPSCRVHDGRRTVRPVPCCPDLQPLPHHQGAPCGSSRCAGPTSVNGGAEAAFAASPNSMLPLPGFLMPRAILPTAASKVDERQRGTRTGQAVPDSSGCRPRGTPGTACRHTCRCGGRATGSC
jgi:hypothetical protein